MLICFYASNASMLPGGVQEGGRGGFGTVILFTRNMPVPVVGDCQFKGGGSNAGSRRLPV